MDLSPTNTLFVSPVSTSSPLNPKSELKDCTNLRDRGKNLSQAALQVF